MFAFQPPLVAEWAMCADDYQILALALTQPPGGCPTIPPEVRAWQGRAGQAGQGAPAMRMGGLASWCPDTTALLPVVWLSCPPSDCPMTADD